MYFIYSLLMGLVALLLTPYWIVQGIRHGKYFSNLGQRLGFSFPSLSQTVLKIVLALFGFMLFPLAKRCLVLLLRSA